MKNPLQHLTDRVRPSHEDAHDPADVDRLDEPYDVLLDERDDVQPADEPEPEPVPGEDGVQVRRNGTLAGVLGAVSGVVAVAYLVRAAGSGSALDWLVFLVVGAVAAFHAAAALDSRTPLLVADSTGIRLRLGRTWQGLPWEELEEVEHAPRQRLLRDGRLVAFPADPDAVLAGLDAGARRQAAIAERVHGAPFAVPLGVTTRVVGAPDGLTAALLALAPDPELVVEVVPAHDEADDQVHDVLPADDADDRDDTDHDDIDDTLERLRPTTALPHDPVPQQDEPREDTAVRPVRVAAEAAPAPAVVPTPAPTPTPTPSPLRQSVAAVRHEVTRRISGHAGDPEETTALRPVREAPDYFATGTHGSAGSDHHETQVMRELAGPAVEPVIGPQLARARQALGLDVERLAERTRIRPHVIDAIEVDDFEPCGGDFYARGHLRTLARVLGVDAAPLLATYDETYADAPIDPKRVFEAELATGSDGAIRSLRGGPNWSVLVAAVMAVVLAWSVARLVLDRSDPTPDSPSLAGDSAGLTSGTTDLAPAVPVVLTAEGGGAKVVVRDGAGAVVFKGNLAFGQSKTLKASPPVRVQTSDGSLTVGIDGEKAESMGRTGRTARNTYVPRSD